MTSLTPVVIERSSCPGVSRDDVVAVLRVELPAQLVEQPPPEGAYAVAIDCSGPSVVLGIAAPGRAPRDYRTNLAGAPPSLRPRIVALAIAEIVRDLDREPPPAPPEPPPAPVVDRRPPPSSAEIESLSPKTPKLAGPVFLGALGEVATFRFDGRWLAGGGLRFEYARGLLCAGIDALLLSADEHVPLGTAQVLLTYASPYVGFAESAGPFQVRLGAGYGAGAARLSGHAADPHSGSATVTGAWMAPYGFGQLVLPMGSSLRLDARVLAGWVVAPVVGEIDGGGDVNLAGFWTSVQIGLTVAL